MPYRPHNPCMTSVSVFGRLRRRLQDILRRRGQSREDIEDVIQDAFLRLEMYYRRGGEVREPEAFLVRAALRLASNARRSVHRRSRAEEAVKSLPQLDVAPDPEEVIAAEQSVNAVNRSLAGVSDSTREVFLLHRIDGLTYSQIAKLYGMTHKAVERRVARAVLAVYRGNRSAQ
jgi:RNA polymerase sigma factor (sigma-70 family)